MSYASARWLIEPHLIQKEIYHACVNDCILFQNEFATKNVCQNVMPADINMELILWGIYLPSTWTKIGWNVWNKTACTNSASSLQCISSHYIMHVWYSWFCSLEISLFSQWDFQGWSQRIIFCILHWWHKSLQSQSCGILYVAYNVNPAKSTKRYT